MSRIKTTILLAALFSCNLHHDSTEQTGIVTEIPGRTTQLKRKEISGLTPLSIDFQFRGACYAYSSNKNAEPSNGEAHSSNLPQKVDKSFPRKGFYLVINQNEHIAIEGSTLGCRLYLVNTTDSLIELKASDSRLYIIAEALDDSNKWMPVSYLPHSDCGNSYHTVKLDQDEYWSFDIPVFKGTTKTKLRYTLLLNKETKITSNEVDAYLNNGQFDRKRKQGYNTNNIMDPYEE